MERKQAYHQLGAAAPRRQAALRSDAYAATVIEASALLAKAAFPIALLVWGVAVAADNTLVAVVSFVFIFLMFVAVVRSGRLRGKRAEGGP